VWDEVCRLLEDPARVAEEYQRRLQAVRTGPRRPELETVERQLAKLRAGTGRLIDSYAEGVISKTEFEPRLASIRQRVAKLAAEAAALQDAAEQARSLQLILGKLETFAALVRDRLNEAEWIVKGDIIRTLVQRIEIDGQHVRVVFRLSPGRQDSSAKHSVGQHCLERHRLVGKPHRQAPAPAQAGLIVWPVGHLVALPWNMVPAVLVQLEGQDEHPEAGRVGPATPAWLQALPSRIRAPVSGRGTVGGV
jgi:hypothetical protein